MESLKRVSAELLWVYKDVLNKSDGQALAVEQVFHGRCNGGGEAQISEKTWGGSSISECLNGSEQLSELYWERRTRYDEYAHLFQIWGQ